MTYRPGDWWTICDRTGFQVYASDTVQEWNGLRVRRQSYEERHPQDFVRGIGDDQTVPFARPDSATEATLGPLTTVINDTHVAGATSITVVSTTGILAGHSLHIMLDNGNMQPCVVLSITNATVLVLTTATKLRGPTSTGNSVVDLSVVTAASLG